MGDYVWHHKDEKGEVTEVWLTAAEQAVDALLVREIDGLAANAARGIDVNGPLCAEQRDLVFANLDKVPDLRRAHHVGQLNTAGVKLPAKKVEVKPAAPAPATDKK